MVFCFCNRVLYMVRFCLALFLASVFYPVFSLSAKETLPPVLSEDFITLEGWKPLLFENIPEQTTYRIIPEEQGAKGVLIAESSSSASGLIYKKHFNCFQGNILSWRWKVDTFDGEKNPRLKAGDDYPIRLYVTFAYTPEKVSFFEKIAFEGLRLLYGEYPPLASLNYVWSGKEVKKAFFESPYTSRAVIIPKDSGREHLGEWREHTVNIPEDYRRAFGEDPPEEASLAIMSDTDNTKGNAKAFFDYIRIKGKAP